MGMDGGSFRDTIIVRQASLLKRIVNYLPATPGRNCYALLYSYIQHFFGQGVPARLLLRRLLRPRLEAPRARLPERTVGG